MKLWVELLKNIKIKINRHGFFISTYAGGYLREWEIELLKEKARKEPLFRNKEEEDA